MVAFSFEFLKFDIRVKWTFLALLLFIASSVGLPITVALVVCLMGHELSHMLVGRYFGYETLKMELMLLGAVAYMDTARASDKEHFFISLAGPLFNFVVAGIVFVLHNIFIGADVGPIDTMFHDVIYLNLVLGLFNMCPAYPMDGGRILKSVLRMLGMRESWALNITHYVGYTFATLFFVGAYYLTSPMLALIGAFVIFHIYMERRSL